MKKIVALLMMVLSLGFSSLGFASPASDTLAKEEEAVNAVMKVLTTNAPLSSAQPYFSDDLKKKFDEKTLANMKKSIDEQIGDISDLHLVVLEKAPEADRLIYAGKAKKAPAVRTVVVFQTKGKKPLMEGVSVMTADVKKQANQNQKTTK
ncbi:MAG: hypothetical protein LKE33_04675 [Acidaminococcus sp.]|jgi:hypothetical protein|nr:hypothetical protein [Acidaminococcus sp.]MCI2100114.1 hypothetical protein [Acidaminococcus sp.]MCI2114391.1 hypothetical protein [Acidaminococcus sp.]MCI2116304.1 hypothetical protein [Acidaminococcus sp.]